MEANGSAQFVDNTLQLTDGGNNEASSAWDRLFLAPRNHFTTQFTFQMTNAQADGFMFVLESHSILGLSGGNLGYGGLSDEVRRSIGSVGIKFDLHNNSGEGNNSTGLYINGAGPTVPARDMTASGINLHSGHPMNVTLSYTNPTLSMTIDDPIANAEYRTSWTVDIPSIERLSHPFAGFTAGTGALRATIRILNWTYLEDLPGESF